jgi:hypothetical protein
VNSSAQVQHPAFVNFDFNRFCRAFAVLTDWKRKASVLSVQVECVGGLGRVSGRTVYLE